MRTGGSNSGRSRARVALLNLSMLLLSMLGTGVASAGADSNLAGAPEYQVKAAFLYNFLKFVDWPVIAPPAGAGFSPGPGVIPAKGGPIVIGVVANPAFADVLEQTVRGKTVNDRPVAVARLSKLAEARGCQEVFLSAPAPSSIPAAPGILTVGEEPRFLNAGGILSFYLEDSRVRFEINTEAAKAAGLHVSPQLLKLGRAR
jgi:hypothetical protein